MINKVIQRFKYQCNTLRFNYITTKSQVIDCISRLIVNVEFIIISTQNDESLFYTCPFAYFNCRLHYTGKHVTNFLFIQYKIRNSRISTKYIRSKFHSLILYLSSNFLMQCRFPSRKAIVEHSPESMIFTKFNVIHRILPGILTKHTKSRSILQFERGYSIGSL